MGRWHDVGEMRRADDGFDDLTDKQALWVRDLRVSRGLTWRMVAEETALAWNGDWESEQFIGREICERAAVMLGEDPRGEPWN